MADKLRKADWEVRPMAEDVGARLIRAHHYSKSASRSVAFVHGLFRRGALWDEDAQGVAWWIPPTLTAAAATYPDNPHGVLALSRLAVEPGVPSNACSFLMAGSRRLIDRERWPCLVTYADQWRGHSGAIYRADNWTYAGLTRPEPTYVLRGRLIARKRGNMTRTHDQMLALGCECLGSFAKHKFVRLA